MLPHRVEYQLAAAQAAPNSNLLGCRFIREPHGATWHYSIWANTTSQRDLWLQQYRECPVVQPTWFYHRSVWELAGVHSLAFQAPIFAPSFWGGDTEGMQNTVPAKCNKTRLRCIGWSPCCLYSCLQSVRGTTTEVGASIHRLPVHPHLQLHHLCTFNMMLTRLLSRCRAFY
jgi:hypothetical protein